MNNPLISIIVPIYNVEVYLRECIDSLLAQTYDNLEIILVDDGSPDNSPAICDEYAVSTSKVRVVHKQNGGLISARKAGIMVANGDYICYVDGDDWVLRNHFENIANAIIQNSADVIVHGLTVASKNSESLKPVTGVAKGFYNREYIEDRIIPVMLSNKPFFNFGIVPSVCSKAFKRDILSPYQLAIPDNVTLGEDALVSYPLLLHASSIEVIDDCGYMYRSNENSMSKAYDRKLANNLTSVFQYLNNSFRENRLYDVIYSQFCDYVSFLTYKAIANELKGPGSVRDAVERMQVFIHDDIISDAIKQKNIPSKIKLSCLIVKHKNSVFAGILKKLFGY